MTTSPGSQQSWGDRLKGAITYAVALVVLLFGASAVTSAGTNAAVEQIADNGRRAAVAAETQARLSAAQACVLIFIDPAERLKETPKCFADEGLPYPFEYDKYIRTQDSPRG
jgi:hypothetical protein